MYTISSSLWLVLHFYLVSQILVAANAVVIFLYQYSCIAILSPARTPLVADDPKCFRRLYAPAHDVDDVV
jgi:hypothetical protein